jgi:hypothetical protein
LYIVGGIPTNPSENDRVSSSVGMMKFPIYGKIKMFQTTNQTMIVVDNTMFLISGGWSFLVSTSAQLFFLIPPSPSEQS